MKNLLPFLWLYLSVFISFNSHAQDKNKSTFYVGAGTNMVNSESKDLGFSNSFHANIDFYQSLWKKNNFGLGIHLLGQYGFGKGETQSFSMIPIMNATSSLKSPTSPKFSGWTIGAGPQLHLRLSSRAILSPIIDFAYVKRELDEFDVKQQYEFSGNVNNFSLYKQSESKVSGLGIIPRLRFQYFFSKNIGLWIEGHYSILPEVTTTAEKFVPNGDPQPQSGKYNVDQIMTGQSESSKKSSNLSGVGFNLGVAIRLGKQQEKEKDAQKGKSVQTEQKKEKRRIVPIYPENNAHFTQENPVKELRWRLLGSPIQSPKYILRLRRVDKRRLLLRSYHTITHETAVPIHQLAQKGLPEGQYLWSVTEIRTGIKSPPQAFSVNNCNINFQIQDTSIVCEGYDSSGNRKYKICFNSSYSSPSGNLTYLNSGSGLSFYDQNNTPLPTTAYSLTSPNTTLQSQAGSSSSTVHYCVEITVPNSLTQLTMLLQGDNLHSIGQCIPSANITIDSLPECICRACDSLTLDINNMQITPYNGQADQYQFSGNLLCNQPLYGVEIQVLSFSYQANPGTCTSGIDGVEENGMILRQGTTVNSSSSVQFKNSNGSPHPNTNASKVIKYISNSAMTGNIPVNIIVGLPGPLPGLDASCCNITYKVCFRVVVFYDQNTCKSCVFTKCFQFDNQ